MADKVGNTGVLIFVHSAEIFSNRTQKGMVQAFSISPRMTVSNMENGAGAANAHPLVRPVGSRLGLERGALGTECIDLFAGEPCLR